MSCEFAAERRKCARLALSLFVGLLPLLPAQGLAGERTTCYPPQHADLPPILDQNYVAARSVLIQSGWQPDFTVARSQMLTTEGYSVGEKWAVDAGFFELETCSGTGMGHCYFVFGDAYGNRLRVVTSGETFPDVPAYPSVSTYRLVCDEEAEASVEAKPAALPHAEPRFDRWAELSQACLSGEDPNQNGGKLGAEETRAACLEAATLLEQLRNDGFCRDPGLGWRHC